MFVVDKPTVLHHKDTGNVPASALCRGQGWKCNPCELQSQVTAVAQVQLAVLEHRHHQVSLNKCFHLFLPDLTLHICQHYLQMKLCFAVSVHIHYKWVVRWNKVHKKTTKLKKTFKLFSNGQFQARCVSNHRGFCCLFFFFNEGGLEE